jgi:hypothetical protein
MKMKRGMQLLIIVVLVIGAGFYASGQSVSLSTGRTMIPGLYAGLRYSHPSFSQVNLAGELFMEQAQLPKISYRAMGANLLAEYINGRDPLEAKFVYKAAIGLSGQVEEEPWIYKYSPFRQLINYGIVSELSGMWNMTEVFSSSLFLQQKFLFNKLLGTTHFIFGLTLSYRLGF